MKLTVAGTPKEYDAGLTVEKLLEVENVEMPLYVTVSLNDEFLQNENFATTLFDQLQDAAGKIFDLVGTLQRDGLIEKAEHFQTALHKALLALADEADEVQK